MPYPTNSVNHFIERVCVEFLAIAILDFSAEPLQFGEQVLEAPVDVGAVPDQLVHGLRHRVVEILHYRVSGEAPVRRRLRLDNARGYADRGRARRHFLHHYRIGANARALADQDRAENFRPGPHHHAFAEGGMAFALVPRRAAERDAVIERAVIADLRRLADDYAHAMVDEKTPPDRSAGMNLDAGQPARQMGNEPRQPSQPHAPQEMGQAVRQRGVKPGVASNYFPSVPGSRVTVEHDRDFFLQAV